MEKSLYFLYSFLGIITLITIIGISLYFVIFINSKNSKNSNNSTNNSNNSINSNQEVEIYEPINSIYPFTFSYYDGKIVIPDEIPIENGSNLQTVIYGINFNPTTFLSDGNLFKEGTFCSFFMSSIDNITLKFVSQPDNLGDRTISNLPENFYVEMINIGNNSFGYYTG